MSRGDFVFDKKLFGERIFQLRRGRKAGQAEIAALLSVSVAQVSDMEHGKSGTTLDKLVSLCEYYRVSSDYLLGLTDDPAWRGHDGEGS